jgi:hypothetical protein
VSDRRSWPFWGALLTFVALLGALPHYRFVLAVGEAVPFFSAYDEPAYLLWAFEGGGPVLPHRWLSSGALRVLATAGGGSWASALVLADLIFPVLCAGLVWRLSGILTRRRTLRLAAAVGLLFAQELFSLGCWTIWRIGDPLGVPAPESAVHDLRQLRAQAPEWLAVLVPDYAGPFLVLFRTPEPQSSLVLLFATLVVLAGLCRDRPSSTPRRALIATGAALNLALVSSYFFVAAAIVALEGALGVALLWWGRRQAAVRALLLAVLGGTSVLVGVLGFHVGQTSQVYGFASRLPVITPAVILAAAGLAVLLSWTRSRFAGEHAPLAAACFATVLFLTNQQLLTGHMITAQFWERYVDYPLVFLGAALTATAALRNRAVPVEALYALAGAWLVLSGALLVRAQDRVFEEEFLTANLKSVAAHRALALVEAQGVHDPTLLFEDPDLDLFVAARTERRISHLLDLTRVFERPIEPLERKNGQWGPRSPFAREAFEYFARRPRTANAVQRLLTGEADTSTYMRFFFDPRDFWTTITDGRRAHLDEVRAQVPAIRRAYEAYLEAGDPCWSRPVVVVTRQSAAERANPRWKERLLAEATVGRERPLMNMHAYLQEPADGVAPAGTCP